MPTTDPKSLRRLVVAVLVLAGIVLTGLLFGRGTGPLGGPGGCRAEVGDVGVEVTTEQAENAALIAAVGLRRGLPARAVSIALATAYQESKLRNLRSGDRDSLGLFQQRPSTGWGRPRQILDPYYAAVRFYDALERVDGYRGMRITDAAQRVQRSGFPEAYQDHAADARALASALTGYRPARFRCVSGSPSAREHTAAAGESGARVDAVRRDLRRSFGALLLPVAPSAGASSGDPSGSAHRDGRALDVWVSGPGAASARVAGPDARRYGWAVAQYLVARADRLGVGRVVFDRRVWRSGPRSAAGWQRYRPPLRPSTLAAVLGPVHVEVAG